MQSPRPIRFVHYFAIRSALFTHGSQTSLALVFLLDQQLESNIADFAACFSASRAGYHKLAQDALTHLIIMPHPLIITLYPLSWHSSECGLCQFPNKPALLPPTESNWPDKMAVPFKCGKISNSISNYKYSAPYSVNTHRNDIRHRWLFFKRAIKEPLEDIRENCGVYLVLYTQTWYHEKPSF